MCRAVAMLQALGIDHDTTDDQIRELAVRKLSIDCASHCDVWLSMVLADVYL